MLVSWYRQCIEHIQCALCRPTFHFPIARHSVGLQNEIVMSHQYVNAADCAFFVNRILVDWIWAIHYANDCTINNIVWNGCPKPFPNWSRKVNIRSSEWCSNIQHACYGFSNGADRKCDMLPPCRVHNLHPNHSNGDLMNSKCRISHRRWHYRVMCQNCQRSPGGHARNHEILFVSWHGVIHLYCSAASTFTVVPYPPLRAYIERWEREVVTPTTFDSRGVPRGVSQRLRRRPMRLSRRMSGRMHRAE